MTDRLGMLPENRKALCPMKEEGFLVGAVWHRDRDDLQLGERRALTGGNYSATAGK